MYKILIFPFLMTIYNIYITRKIINENNRLIQLKFDEYNKKFNNN
jgi:hypothetical protein